MKQMSIFALMLAALIGVSPLFAEEAPKAEAEKTRRYEEEKLAAETAAAEKAALEAREQEVKKAQALWPVPFSVTVRSKNNIRKKEDN